jgi:hypothetical protein
MHKAEIEGLRSSLLILVSRGPCNDFAALHTMRELLDTLSGTPLHVTTQGKVQKLRRLFEMWLSGRGWDPYGYKTKESRELRVRTLALCADLGGLLSGGSA